MWPQKLIEVLPHLTRLAPLAEKFFATRSAADAAQQAAWKSFQDDVNKSVAEISETNSGLQRTMLDYGQRIDALAVEIARSRMMSESVEARLRRIEKMTAAAVWLSSATILISGAVLVAVLLMRR